MHPSISINTLSLAPAGLDNQVDTIARLGACATSPDLEQVHSFGIVSTVRHLQAVQLEVATLTHHAFSFATPEAAAAGRDRLVHNGQLANLEIFSSALVSPVLERDAS
jgi:hypothetical protein